LQKATYYVKMDGKYYAESKFNGLYPNKIFILILHLSFCIVWMCTLLPTFDAENGGSRYVRNIRNTGDIHKVQRPKKTINNAPPRDKEHELLAFVTAAPENRSTCVGPRFDCNPSNYSIGPILRTG
jgi:hypothetical protein